MTSPLRTELLRTGLVGTSQVGKVQVKMHLRMEFDTGVGPTCYFFLFLFGCTVRPAKLFTLFIRQFLSPYCTEDFDLGHFSTNPFRRLFKIVQDLKD